MKKKLKDLAKLVKGEVSGNAEISISGVSPIETAVEGDLTFVLEAGNLKAAEASKATALVAPRRTRPTKPAILVGNPRLALAQVLSLFMKKRTVRKGVHKTAVIREGVKLGKDVSVGPFVTIEEGVRVGARTTIHPGAFIGEGSEVGEDCVIRPNVVIYEGVKIGNRVVLNAGVVVGVDGFGFAQEDGRHAKIPQVGGVVIEDDVEIYANSTIARATMNNTVIGRGTKIDCLCQIAHNVTVGEDCAITAMVGLAGSSSVGNRVFVGGKASLSNKVSVGDNSLIMGKAGVTKNFPANSVISGFPARDHKKDLEAQALTYRLPELFRKVAELEKGPSKDRP